MPERKEVTSYSSYVRPANRPSHLSDIEDVTGSSLWLNPDKLEQTIVQGMNRRRQLGVLSNQVTPEMGQRASYLLTDHAGLGPDLLTGLLITGAEGPSVDYLADLDAEEDGDDGVWGFISGIAGGIADTGMDALGHLNEQVLKPTIRGVTLLGESGYHEIERLFVSTGQTPFFGASNPAASVGEFKRRYKEFGDSTLLNIAQGDTGGKSRFDLGTGYFPGGGAAEETERERTLEFEGRRANMGQMIAQSTVGEFYSPGDAVYDVVAGVTQFGSEVALDPTAAVAAPLAAGRRATKALSLADNAFAPVRKVDELGMKAGLVHGSKRRTIIAERTRDFLAGPDSEAMLQKIADADAFEIHRRFKDSRANRYSIDMARTLGDAKTVPAVRETLEGLINQGLITERGFFPGQGNFIRRTLLESDKLPRPGLKVMGPDAKFRGIAATGTIHAEDLDEAASKLSSLYRQANVPKEQQRALFNELAEVSHGDYDGLKGVYAKAMRTVAGHVHEDTKLGREVVADLTSRWIDEVDQFRTGSHSTFAWDAKTGTRMEPVYAKSRKVTVEGETVEWFEPTPTLTSELGHMTLQLPEADDIRRASAKLGLARKVYTSKGWGSTVDFTNKVTGTVFKTAVLLRPAFAAREFFEAQTAMAATGYDNMLTHPMNYIHQVWGMRHAKGGKITDLTGNDLYDVAERERALTLNAGGWLNKDELYNHSKRAFDVTAFPDDLEQIPREFLTGWRKEMGRISSAPEGRMMAELGGDVEAWKEWARGAGRRDVERLFKATTRKGFDDELLSSGMRTPLEETAGRVDFDQALPLRDEAAFPTSPPDPFEVKLNSLAEIVRTRVDEITGGWDPDLLRVIADKSVPFDEVVQNGRMYARRGRDMKDETHNFHNILKAKAGQGIKPPTIKVENLEYAKARKAADDSVLNTLKEAIFNKPVNYFSRYPMFRQSMARRSAELMDLVATDELRDEIFDATVSALNLNSKGAKHFIAELETARTQARGVAGIIDNIDDYNELVKTKAVDDVTSTLFDVANKGAGQEVFGSIVPFLDAYKETLTRWSRFAKDNPAFFLRGSAGVRELNDQGIFYADENSGEMMFRAPGGGAISKIMGMVAGGPAQGVTSTLFEARVGGLNIATDSLGPGFGPIVELSASFLKDPRYDGVKEALAPFGLEIDNPKDLLSFDAAKVVMPAWARKGFTALNDGFDERLYASTFSQSVDAFAASGKYDLNDPEAVQEMMDDAGAYTRTILVARTLGQAFMPTGPYASVETEIENPDRYHPDWDPENDKDGKWFTVGAMSADYYRLAEVYGFDLAVEKFYEMYGREPFYFATGASTSGGKELPVTEQGDRWMRRNSDVVRDFPAIAGFFAPPSEDGAALDFSALERQIRNGDRQVLTPDLQVRLAQSARARTLMRNINQQTEDLPANQRDRLRHMIRDQLSVQFPGWQDDPIDRVPAAVKMQELEAASKDPRLSNEPLTAALRQYFDARNNALEDVRVRTGAPNATLGRQDAAPHREALRSIGQNLQMTNPAFAGVWSSLLLGELEDE